MYSLESPHQGDSNENTQYTLIKAPALINDASSFLKINYNVILTCQYLCFPSILHKGGHHDFSWL